MKQPPRLVTCIAPAIAALALLSSAPAYGQVQLSHSIQVALDISPLTGEARVDSLPLHVDLDPVKGGQVEFTLHWPDNPATARDITVKLVASAPRFDSRPEGVFKLTATVEGLEDTPIETAQNFWVQDGGLSLLEVLRIDDEPLTLAIRISTREIPFVSGRQVEIGAPLTLNLEIHRVDGEKTVRLETNRLQTFVGQSVSYSFDLGHQIDSAALRLSFRPTRLFGEIVEIVVDVHGKLPIDGELLVIGRSETWIASRGVPSSIAITGGAPAAGYRFVVTPEF